MKTIFSNVFFKSSVSSETARLKKELKAAKAEFKELAKGTHFRNEKLDIWLSHTLPQIDEGINQTTDNINSFISFFGATDRSSL